MSLKGNENLAVKYNKPVPRYTSYPTVPFWKEEISKSVWESNFRHEFVKNNRGEGISLYIHLPFCESLCTYCGCNKKITTNHSVEEDYLETLQKEWNLYLDMMNEKPVIRELHLGGGTPTFFSAANLEKLLTMIFSRSAIHPQHEFSIEGHPNNTTEEQLQTLFNLGFRRISYGVQDNDPEVQRIINRIQPLENVIRATETARKTGFTSVNFDLIYGLPRQTKTSMERTIGQVLGLKPDRIAFYSYAHVPWTSRAQRLFDENDLPSASEKLELYLTGKQLLTAAGYEDIGMDHFALPHDELFKAWQQGTLHRNFMGYTTQHTSFLLGLGVSSISDTGTAYAQNEKSLHDYYASIRNNETAVKRGYFLSAEDTRFKQYILDINCRRRTTFHEEDRETLEQYTFPELELLAGDGLVEWNRSSLTVKEAGHHFIRNICRAFDLHLLKNSGKEGTPLFSKAV